MKNRLKQKYQKDLTKIIREFNNELKRDPLWQGRFYIMQRKCKWIEYGDGSGGLMSVTFRIYDHKTNEYLDDTIGFSPSIANFTRWEIFSFANNFIIEYLKVWMNEKPYKDKKDYTKIHYMQNDKREPKFINRAEI